VDQHYGGEDDSPFQREQLFGHRKALTRFGSNLADVVIEHLLRKAPRNRDHIPLVAEQCSKGGRLEASLNQQ
jgi:hypothetical protein